MWKMWKTKTGLKSELDLVDKLTELWICRNVGGYLVSSVHNARMIPASEEMADFLEG